MKNNLQKIFSLAAFCFIFGCAASCFAQIKTGGYKSISVNDAGVRAAADFAVQAKSDEQETDFSLESIETAETQVVAGTNYRLCMQIYVPGEEAETDGVTGFIKAVVFRNLKKEFSLKSWDEVEECSK
ncbi:MAG: cystatin domain-containing protein [Pyrinomonadaceae bacterium]